MKFHVLSDRASHHQTAFLLLKLSRSVFSEEFITLLLQVNLVNALVEIVEDRRFPQATMSNFRVFYIQWIMLEAFFYLYH